MEPWGVFEGLFMDVMSIKSWWIRKFFMKKIIFCGTCCVEYRGTRIHTTINGHSIHMDFARDLYALMHKLCNSVPSTNGER